MQTRRSIICEECKLPRRTNQWFDVCNRCVRNLPKVRCSACAWKVRRLQPDSSLCRKCAGKYAKQMSACEECGRVDYMFLSDPCRCRKCHTKTLKMSWKKSFSKNIVCSDCGLTKTRRKQSKFCYACYHKRHTSEGKCTFAGCSKLVANKKWQLCVRHNTDRLAPKALSDYVKHYYSPFPQNVRYFLVLIAKLRVNDSDSLVTTIGAHDLLRYRTIGKYLQVYELPEILTWRAIHDALPKPSKRGQVKCQLIRSGLWNLATNYCKRDSCRAGSLI